MFIDVHAHLYYDDKLNDEKCVINAKDYGVEKIICSGSDIENSKRSVEIAEKFDGVYASVGVHPDDVGGLGEKELSILEELAKSKKVVAIGEIGLDYNTSEVPKEEQKDAFIKQIKLADKLGLPVVIHSREATGDTIDVLKSNLQYLSHGIVMHCFNKNSTVAKIFLDMGCYLSIGGALTFPNSEKLKQAVKEIPLDRILLETDCPYMTPVPFRGQVNEPKNVIIVADEIAKIKGITPEEVGKQTTLNAIKVFGI